MLQWQIHLSNYIVPMLWIALYNCQGIHTTNSDYKSREMWEDK